MTRNSIWRLFFLLNLSIALLGITGCGKSSATEEDDPLPGDPVDVTDAGGEDGSATVPGDATVDSGGDPSDDAGPIEQPGECLKLGAQCSSAADCCQGSCDDGVCSMPACTSDGESCTSASECCSGACEDGACAPLNSTCKTLGNACEAASECCSGRCAEGSCQPSSFCGQQGDICSTSADCCGGICNLVEGSSKGLCAKPPAGAANCSLLDGELCDGDISMLEEGGIPDCGGKCCSRACAPWGPTGVFICQPASGCQMTGGICTKNSDCCGSEGMPGTKGLAKPVTCEIAEGATVGVCRNPQGCNPDGTVCKLATTSCNATCDCCSGNCNSVDSCKQDSLGIPRCAGPECVEPGGACASSANCCDGLPCVPNPDEEGAPFICYDGGGSCVPACGSCTIDGDCCPGASCISKPGSTEGICGPCVEEGPDDPDAGVPDGGIVDGGPDADIDGGDTPCALYGQECSTNDDCCGSVPCTRGTCHYDIR